MSNRSPRAGRAVVFAALFGAAASAQGATETQMWHSMTGALGDRVTNMADRFNKSQNECKVNAVFKGSYPESMAAAIAAYRAKNPPAVVQVFEVGTGTMMAAKGAIKPVHQVMTEAGEKFDPKSYVAAVAGYYTSPSGQMLSFPFNSSTAVFYYNKDAFAKAGLNPDQPPQTWPAVAAAAEKLKSSGMACGFTPGWQGWTQLENFSAWHNLPYATKSNGFGGTDARLAFNGDVQVRHVQNLKNWMDRGWVTYGGRKNEPEAKFFSGECGMLISSSAAYANIKRNAKFKFGVAPLPYYADVAGAPQNSIIGGASLWVMAGKPKAEYACVAKFFSFVSNPVFQAEWHQQTGYLPITAAAYDITKKSGFYDQNPGTDVSVQQMIVKTTNNSRGIRLGNFVQIRDIVDEELEAVWSGKKTAKQALDDAVKRGNEQLERFEKANKG